MLNTTRWPYPRVIAHRGGGTTAPENTLVALRLAATMGFGGVEFDVKLAGSGVPVLMHDDTVDRTTDGSGPVASLDVGALRRLDAGVWFGNEFAGERIPTFEGATNLCHHLGLWANIEIKPDAGNAVETGRIVASMTARLWSDDSPAPLLSSFSEAALGAAAAAAPSLPRALLVEEPPADWRERAARFGCRALHCRHDHVSAALVAAAHAAGLGILAYTVNDAQRAMGLFAIGVDAIVTDELGTVRPDELVPMQGC